MRHLRIEGMALVAGMLVLAAVPALGQPGPQPSPDAVKEMQAQRLAYNRMPDTPGTGPYPAIKQVVASLPDHVIYRPKDLAALGKEKLGIFVWGNGGCSADGASARLHLSEIASHGYLAIAPGAILSGPGAPPAAKPAPGFDPGKLPPVATTTAALIAAIDWAYAENARPDSPFHNRLDLQKLGVGGHSCGGLQALQAAADPRVHAVIINNSGVFADGSNPIPGMEVDKSLLKKLHTPVLYILGGPTDIAYPNGMDDFAKIDHVPVMVANIAVGHSGTFAKPNGGAVAQVSVHWLDWQLKGDTSAAHWFVGADCRLCTDPTWKIERKGIE